MIGWLGSCHPEMNALKLNILNTFKVGFILYDANVMRININRSFK